MKYRTMKEIPYSERPYEKCREHGAAALSDAELLAVILRSGSSKLNCLDLAREVLLSAGEDGRLRNLRKKTAASYLEIKGIGEVKSIVLECIGELCERMSEPDREKKISMSNPEKIASYYMNVMGAFEQEEFWLLLLDTKNRRIRDVKLTRGTVNASLVSTREMFAQALEYKAVGVVMIHNHPSGDPTPSQADIEVTLKAIEAGKLLDIRVLDHIIVGRDTFYSMRSNDVLEDHFM